MDLCNAFNNRLFLFLFACCSGILFALVWRKYEQTVRFSFIQHHYSAAVIHDSNYNQWLKNQGFSSQIISEEDLSFSKKPIPNLESSFLYSTVPVLCLVFVSTHENADSVKQTWAKNCNIVTFFGNFVDDKIPVMKIPQPKSFKGFCYAFIHIWKKYRNQFKWVIIADDNTFVIVQNLRHYVAALNSSVPYYLGHPAKDYSNFYNLGSAGIVLSHECMLLLAASYKSADNCTSSPSWYLDTALGKIFHSYHIYPFDTRDSELKGRFNPFSVEDMLIPGSISVFSSYWRTSLYLSNEGINCCSDEAITFHDFTPSKMFLFEYLLYHLSVFKYSLKGLGNKRPNSYNTVNKFAFSSKVQEPSGEAFVKLIDPQKTTKNVIKHGIF